MMTNARFPDVAYWEKKVFSDNNSIIGCNSKTTAFRCVENTLKVKTVSSLSDGATKTVATVAIRSDENNCASIEPDDSVTYKGYNYSVVSVAAVRSVASIGAKEYIITLV